MELNKDDLMNGLFGKIEINYNEEKIYDIPLDLVEDLESIEHAYEKSLRMGLGIEELAEQIKTVGQQQPAVLRKKANGKYETLIGHRRKRACILAGKETIKAVLRQCTDDEAALISTDNLGQRPHTFLSEIAKAYQIQMQALKNQGKRTDLLKKVEAENDFGQELPKVNDEKNDQSNFRQKLPKVNEDKQNNFGQKLPGVTAREIIAERYKISPRKVSYFLRLNYLIPELIDMVDNGEIPFMAGVHLSYLKEKEQTDLAGVINSNCEIKITVDVARELREASQHMLLNNAIIEATVNPPKEDRLKDFITKPSKPGYKVAFKGVEKYIKKLDAADAEKLMLADPNELEEKIKEAIINYLQNL